MATRRSFLGGALAATVLPRVGWADVGDPAYLAASKMADGRYYLQGLSKAGGELFRLALPGRGHAAAAHPERAEAVAFARRPGRFAVVIDCASGRETARLEAPEGRHFYGHGAYLQGGAVLATSENDYAQGLGVIGFWAVDEGYARIGEVASGGVGPHEIVALGADQLLVANGGIRTHPESAREKLNLATMRPNLAVVSQAGVSEVAELAPELHHASIRHLALRADGLAGFAMQWQGEDMAQSGPLLGLWRAGEAPRLCETPEPRHLAMKGYAGSVAFTSGGAYLAITSPRGGEIQIFDAESAEYVSHWQRKDICGLAGLGEGFLASDGAGALFAVSPEGEGALVARHEGRWDNHIVQIGAV